MGLARKLSETIYLMENLMRQLMQPQFIWTFRGVCILRRDYAFCK